MTGKNTEAQDHARTQRPARQPLILAVISLVIGAMAALALVGGVQATAGSRAMDGQPGFPEQLSGANHGDSDSDEAEVKGTLAEPVTAFAGEWIVNVDSNRTVTLVLTATTDVQKFMNHLPSVGDWVEAKGTWTTPTGWMRAAYGQMSTKRIRSLRGSNRAW